MKLVCLECGEFIEHQCGDCSCSFWLGADIDNEMKEEIKVSNNDLAEVANAIARRMVEIESNHVSKSAYRELGPNEQDECPTGETYNLLWDALLDEFHAVGVDLAGMVQAYER